MKKIIAKLQDGNFCTIFNSDNDGYSDIADTYQIPIFSDEKNIIFNPEIKLESDEWFYVVPDEEQKRLIIEPYFSTLSNIDSLNPITKEDYPNIRAICLVEDGENEKIILTRVFPRFYTIAKRVIKWKDGPKLEKQSSSVEFTGNIDAYWINGKLFFKSYSNIKSVFDGLEDFYRKATKEEINVFLQKDFFFCSNFKFRFGERNSRKIAAVMDSIEWENTVTRKKYIDYANQYPNIGVQINEDGKMIIGSNNDVTRILCILEERIFTTPITAVVCEAHSINKVI